MPYGFCPSSFRPSRCGAPVASCGSLPPANSPRSIRLQSGKSIIACGGRGVYRAWQASNRLSTVMPALVAGIHVFLAELQKQGVDGRDKPGPDSLENGSTQPETAPTIQIVRLDLSR